MDAVAKGIMSGSVYTGWVTEEFHEEYRGEDPEYTGSPLRHPDFQAFALGFFIGRCLKEERWEDAARYLGRKCLREADMNELLGE